MMNDQYFFKLFSSCILVKGASQSTICDLQRNRIKIIPNLLYDVLLLTSSKSILDVKDHYQRTQDEGIDKYFDLLIKDDYGFLTDEPILFPDMDLSWDTPSEITNSIIDFNKFSNHPIKKIINELSELGCRSVLMRFFDKVAIERLYEILENVLGSRINSVGLVMEFNPILNSNLTELYLKFPFLKDITFFNAPQNQYRYDDKLGLRILMTMNAIDSEESCGEVDKTLFSINISHFTESISYNSCLNCKVGIDKTGLVKNCPSMKLDFDNINQVSLKDVIGKKEFKFFGSITKDHIDGCKDCEFRYVCTDCRAYTENNNNPYSKPKKCRYDPYTASWN